MGDVVFVELPEVGTKAALNGEIAVVESVKTASDIYSPASGEVTETNESLDGTPELINEDAEGKAWLYKMKIDNQEELEGLMDAKAYSDLIGSAD